MKKRFFLLFVMVGLLVTLASCAASNKYVKLTLSEDYYEVYKGQTLEILPIVNKGSAVGDVTIEYSSYDETIATYVNGNLQGVEYGETIIKVVYAGNATICDVAKVKVVEHDLASEVGVEDTAISFYETDTYQINYTAASEAVYTFESSNEDVATVDANGLVTAALNGAQHNDGKAVITVTASDKYGAVEDVVFTVEVTVKEAHFAITLDLAGGAIAGEYANEYDVHALPHVLPTPEKDGYDFAGWLGADGEVVYEVPAGSEAAVSYTAQWKERVYNISYDLDGGALAAGAENPATYKADEEVTLVAPEKVGHTFAGWEADGVKFETFPSDAYKDLAVKALWTANTYKVTYVENDATANANKTEFTYGVGLELVAAERTGYTFLGWYDAAEEGNKVTAIAADVAEDVTLYAYWQINEYVIRFFEGEGTQVPNITLKITDEAYDLTAEEYIPVLEGHTFKGWYKDFNCEGELVNEIPSGTHEEYTLYAKWEANVYEIAYEADGATKNENPATYTYGQAVAFADPEKTGYTFVAWYLDAEFTQVVTGISATQTGDVKVYAKWEINLYDVTFNDLPTANFQYKITDETYDLTAEAYLPTKEGHTFKGWFVGDVEYKSVVTGSHEDLALVAKWEANVYEISYEADGATKNENETSYTYGVGYAFVNPEKTGYTFDGWYSDDKLTTPVTGVSATQTGAVKVYAKWTINVYTITFDVDGGSAVAAIEYKITDPELSLAEVISEKAGHTFLGWYNGDVKVEAIASGSHENLTLVAKWDADTYAVKYEGVEAALHENAATYDFGVGLTFTEATKTGYEFLGWFDAAEGGNKVTAISTTQTGDVTVYAQWSIITYTVTFVTDGSAVAAKTYKITDETISLADDKSEKTGYSFLGWYKGEEKVTEIKTGSHENYILEAKWLANVYSVEYVLDGGVNASANVASYTYGVGLVLAEATKAGYEFVAWYDNAEFTGTAVAAISATQTGAVKLYAKFVIINYTVTFDADGGSAVADKAYTIESGLDLAEVKSEKVGHTFLGWYNDADKKVTSIEAGSTGAVALKAKWIANTYTVSYELNGGVNAAANPTTYVYGVGATIEEATKANYELVAIKYYDAEDNAITGISATQTGNVKVVFEWTPVVYNITYVTNDGSAVAAGTYTIETKAVLGETTKAYYDFVAWHAVEDLSDAAVTADTLAALLKDVTLYAEWTPTVYTITYEGTSSAVNPNPTTYTVESETITFEAISAEHLTFLGWFKDEACTVKFEGIEKGSNGNVTVYASWTATVYEIEYHLDSKAYFEATPVTEYTVLDEVELLVPTKPGYKFVGWYNNAELTGEAIVKLAEGTYGKQDLYPAWEARTYNVEFVVAPYEFASTVVTTAIPAGAAMYDVAEAPASFTYQLGQTNTLPVLTAEGYEFVGWYFIEGVTLTKLEVISEADTAEYVFYAFWKKLA